MPSAAHSPESPFQALAGRLARLVILLYAAQLIWWAFRADILELLAVVPDDTAYYLQIARHVAAGTGFTFDGLHPTNGYQPLWQWLLVPVFAVIRLGPEAMLRIVLALQSLMLGGALLVLFRVLRRSVPGQVLLPGAVVYGFVVLVMGVDGMETALLASGLALLVAVALSSGTAFRGTTAAPPWIWGALLGLVMLARLDSVFLGLSVGVFIAAQAALDPSGRGAHVRRLVRMVTGAAAVVVPYLIGNFLAFGDAMPISARLKSCFPHLSPDGLAPLPRIQQALVLLALAWIVGVIVALARRRGRPTGRSGPSELDLTVAVLAGYVVLHALHVVLFLKWAVFTWHFAGNWTFAGLALMALATRLLPLVPPMLLRPAPYCLAVILLAAFAGWRVHLRQERTTANWHTATWEAAAWARTATPDTAIFAMKDSGNFGYFSERRTINLDGVVNTREYQDVLRDKGLAEYLKQAGVSYLVQHAFPDRPDVSAGTYTTFTMAYQSHLHESWSDTLPLPRTDEIFRSRPYPDHGAPTVLAIWKFPVE